MRGIKAPQKKRMIARLGTLGRLTAKYLKQMPLGERLPAFRVRGALMAHVSPCMVTENAVVANSVPWSISHPELIAVR